jgi:biotin carboxyl carrier protein
MTIDVLAGEQLLVPERVIISPVSGVFRPTPPQTVTSEGEVVYVGQVVGMVETTAGPTPVTSPFTGFFMGLMAHEGERVHEDQPVVWLRTSAAA